MAGSEHQVVFSLDGQRYAISIVPVQRIVRAVEVSPLSGSSEGILGVINVRGLLVPVFHTRRLLGLPEREIDPSDQFIIVDVGLGSAVIVVDTVHEVIDRSPPPVQAAAASSAAATIEPGVTLIPDVRRFLRVEQYSMLWSSLQQNLEA